ncbi:hypothetical protein F4820DRAFT_448420 [Hypoxylon rubiginosum]|uniref:Uncharacterized protein n=1 Tax=Hypoxylon rubiginosum TaxID=110542 RepID=A0ACB9Z026_9PEZI|nr:hypothetical protein F4820DRAFT_448420 [Hypoxylon rubiginosum]
MTRPDDNKSSNLSSCISLDIKPRYIRTRAEGCPHYDLNYVRNERVYYSLCDDCVRKRAAAINDFSDKDLCVNLANNHLLLEEMMNGIRQKEYFQLVRDFYSEYKITRRYVLYGSRWYEVTLPDPDTLTLQPDPPYWLDVGTINWLSQIITDDMLDEVAREFRESQRPLLEQKLDNWLDQVHSVGIPEQQIIHEAGFMSGQVVLLGQEPPPQDEFPLDAFEFMSQLEFAPE